MPTTKAPVKYKELCHDKKKCHYHTVPVLLSLKKSSQRTSIDAWKI
jgi:hypothetical protein